MKQTKTAQKGIEKLMVKLGQVIKKTEEEVFVVFQDGRKVFKREEYDRLMK